MYLTDLLLTLLIPFYCINNTLVFFFQALIQIDWEKARLKVTSHHSPDQWKFHVHKLISTYSVIFPIKMTRQIDKLCLCVCVRERERERERERGGEKLFD